MAKRRSSARGIGERQAWLLALQGVRLTLEAIETRLTDNEIHVHLLGAINFIEHVEKKLQEEAPAEAQPPLPAVTG